MPPRIDGKHHETDAGMTDRFLRNLGIKHKPPRVGGAGVRPKGQRQWVRPGDVPVQVLTGSPADQATNLRVQAEDALRRERAEREAAERRAAEAEAERVKLETRLGHEMLARREAEARAVKRETRWSVEIAPGADATPAQDRPEAKHQAGARKPPLYDHPRRKRGRQPGYSPRLKGFVPPPEEPPVPPAATAEPEPVEWWIKGWHEKYGLNKVP